MTIEEYETLVGITVATSQRSIVTAAISITQFLIESKLGFTLDPDKLLDVQYVETGKTASECPCDADLDTLLDPDPVKYAYRVFRYESDIKILTIDPATEIESIKLVRNGVTYKTLTEDEYSIKVKNGFIKYIEICECLLSCLDNCKCVQLAVDADWAFDTIPDDLQYLWTDMITFYSDQKRNIKSETLATHSYTKSDNIAPENKPENIAILNKYAGPNGTLMRTLMR